MRFHVFALALLSSTAVAAPSTVSQMIDQARVQLQLNGVDKIGCDSFYTSETKCVKALTTLLQIKTPFPSLQLREMVFTDSNSLDDVHGFLSIKHSSTAKDMASLLVQASQFDYHAIQNVRQAVMAKYGWTSWFPYQGYPAPVLDGPALLTVMNKLLGLTISSTSVAALHEARLVFHTGVTDDLDAYWQSDMALHLDPMSSAAELTDRIEWIGSNFSQYFTQSAAAKPHFGYLSCETVDEFAKQAKANGGYLATCAKWATTLANVSLKLAKPWYTPGSTTIVGDDTVPSYGYSNSDLIYFEIPASATEAEVLSMVASIPY